MRGWLSVLVIMALVATVAAPGIALAAPLAQRGLSVGGAFEGATAEKSYNWAGYAAVSGSGTVTKVTGAWVEPAVKCPTGVTVAVFWVGIDGISPSTTVEQTGTYAECSGGVASYYSWWETYPANTVQIFGSIKAGDHFTASVTHKSGSFTMSIKDTTSGVSWTKTSKNSGAIENSAECIAERPAGASNASGLYALANFGKITFTSCTATISGVTGGIGTFATVYDISMVNYSSGTRTLASTSALTSNTKFTVTWKHAS